MDDRRFRAFLSHSSRDKPFVEAAAVALGRQHCVLDRYCFRTGQELQDAIEGGLDSSAVVVLFASKAALASEWVAFELDEAWKRKVGHRLSKVLTVAIDPDLSASDLPPWLRSTLFRHFASPQAAAREVRRHLEDTVGRRFQPIFVGRQHETQQFERDMLDLDSAPKRLFVLQGLDGIGRRTFADRVARDILNFDRIVPFGVRVGDGAATITHALAVHVESYVTPEQLTERAAALAAMPLESAAKEFVELVCKFHEIRELPVLIDEGGLLSDVGEFNSQVLTLLDHLSNARNAYLGFVTGRRPSRTAIQDSVVPVVHIPALRDEDTRRLLGRLFDREGIESTSERLTELAEYCKGHPPSAYFATNLARLYGVASVLADKAQLVEFRAAPYVRYLGRQNSISDEDARVLRLLASYGALPLEVVASAAALSAIRTAESLRRLIDLSLVQLERPERYAISRPVEDAVFRVYGYRGVDHDAVRKALDDYLTEAPKDVKDVALPSSLWLKCRRGIANPVSVG